MPNMIDKEKLMRAICEKVNYLQHYEDENDNAVKAMELKQLLYVISKGCFDSDIA